MTFPGSDAEIRPVNSSQDSRSNTVETPTDRLQLVALSIRETLSVLNSNLPLDDVLAHLVREASRLLDSDLSVLYIQNSDDHVYEMKAAAGGLPTSGGW